MSLNEYAKGVWDVLEQHGDRYHVKVSTLPNHTKVLDCGVKVLGGFSTGLQVSLASLGGLGHVSMAGRSFGDHFLPHITVRSDHPAQAMLGCQMGWFPQTLSDLKAVISGPGRILAQQPPELFTLLKLNDPSDVCVYILQANQLPTEKTAEDLANYSNVDPRNLYLIVAPMQSLTGTVQIASRSVEAVMLKLWKHLRFNPHNVKHVMGSAPIAPPCTDLSRFPSILPDDMLVYGGRVILYLDGSTDTEVERLADHLIPHTSASYGRPFRDLLNNDPANLKNIDINMFTVGHITLINLQTGTTITRGSINPTFVNSKE
jgi:methenyltetrahydromethanopterin cyclohydrolase